MRRVPLIIGILAACLCPLASADRLQRTPLLAFVRGPSIFVASGDGSHLRVVVAGTAVRDRWAYDPAWSSDGKRLAVAAASTPTGTIPYTDIGVSDGNGNHRLVVGERCGGSPVHRSPSWSPDDRRLVFVSDDPLDASGGLYVAGLGSNKCVQVTPRGLPPPDTEDDMPAWSPDGLTIAFVRVHFTFGANRLLRSLRARLYVVRPDGRNLKELLPTRAENPSWSPDSRRLVFDDGHRIVTVDADGRHLQYLTDPPGRDAAPAWSPDGRTIAFVRYPSATSKTGSIWLMNSQGGRLKLLIRNATQPAWKPG